MKFMERDLIAPRVHDRWTMSHAVGVGCVLEFMSAGLSSPRAVEMVDEMFGVVDAATYEFGKEKVADTWWLNAINFADGSYGWASGPKDAETFGDGTVASKVSINIAAVMEKMVKRVGTPRDPENAED